MATILDRQRTIPHRIDVDAYYAMGEAGVLDPDARHELIDGEVVTMPPIGHGHAGTTDLLHELAVPVMAGRLAIVANQRPLRLDDTNEPQPDLMLLRPRPDHYRTSHPTAADVLLLIEVADSSLVKDRALKLPLYARFAIPEVWLVDLRGQAVEVCREPVEGEYAERERVTGGRLATVRVPAFEVDVAGLFA